jgi:hypothetical protein
MRPSADPAPPWRRWLRGREAAVEFWIYVGLILLSPLFRLGLERLARWIR